MRRAICKLISLLGIYGTGLAFVPSAAVFSRVNRLSLSPVTIKQTPEIIVAIDEVRTCATKFGPKAVTFVNVWIDETLKGKQDGMAVGLLDECLLDDNEGNCERFEEALKRLDGLLGVSSNEQY